MELVCVLATELLCLGHRVEHEHAVTLHVHPIAHVNIAPLRIVKIELLARLTIIEYALDTRDGDVRLLDIGASLSTGILILGSPELDLIVGNLLAAHHITPLQTRGDYVFTIAHEGEIHAVDLPKD